jgi:hypothetical protein
VIVVLVLVALLVAGIHDTHSWPVDWRLYSNTKGPTAGGYYAYRVGRDSGEHLIDFEKLPYAYQRTRYILARFHRVDDAERASICAAIAGGAHDAGGEVHEVNLYWERRRVVPVDGERHTKLIERELRYTCAGPSR